MKFLLQLSLRPHTPVKLHRTVSIGTTVQGNTLFVEDKLHRVKSVKTEGSQLFWLGDMVIPEHVTSEGHFLEELVKDFNPAALMDVGGFFYVIYVDENKSEVTVCHSFGGMLPVYYTIGGNTCLVSSDLSLIQNASLTAFDVSKRFILEKMLFNYPLSDVSFLENVRSLPAFHQLIIGKEIKTEKYFDLSSFFVSSPENWKKWKTQLTDLFISRLEKYIPDDPYCLSFTGGFDGRSLLAGANLFHLPKLTYSFGRSNNLDIVIPQKQSASLGIPYEPYLLDEEKYLERSLDYGLQLVDTSDGIADFARAHYLYAIDDLSKKYAYCLTGTMGSEIFRALHVTGSFMSKGTFTLFTHEDPESAFRELFEGKDLEYLQLNGFRKEMDALKEYLADSGYFFTDEDKNQAFYRLVFDVMFRGYFGQEIKAFNRYLNNRAPYFDFTFIKELMRTGLSGVYSDFFEHNPLKRFKGQLFYAELIKKSGSSLYKMDTAKGYSPYDLNTTLGKLKIGVNFLRKRNQSATVEDPFCVREAFRRNLPKLGNSSFESALFDLSAVERDKKEMRNVPGLIKVLSLNYWVTKHINS